MGWSAVSEEQGQEPCALSSRESGERRSVGELERLVLTW